MVLLTGTLKVETTLRLNHSLSKAAKFVDMPPLKNPLNMALLSIAERILKIALGLRLVPLHQRGPAIGSELPLPADTEAHMDRFLTFCQENGDLLTKGSETGCQLAISAQMRRYLIARHGPDARAALANVGTLTSGCRGDHLQLAHFGVSDEIERFILVSSKGSAVSTLPRAKPLTRARSTPC